MFKISPSDSLRQNDLYLTVSAQMHAEAAIFAHPRIFTFGSVFRAEPHATNRHLCEFPMLEVELAFLSDLESLIKFSEDLLKQTISRLVDNTLTKKHLEHCWEKFGRNQECFLEGMVAKPFTILEFSEVASFISRGTICFERPFIFEEGLSTEVERWLCEKVVGGPVFVINYPKSSKPFYMKANPDEVTVANFDLLIPGQLEIAGGSLREDHYGTLKSKIESSGMKTDNLKWYLDLRKYSSVPHGGFGFGFDRILQAITGCPNIRDASTFPRIAGEISHF